MTSRRFFGRQITRRWTGRRVLSYRAVIRGEHGTAPVIATLCSIAISFSTSSIVMAKFSNRIRRRVKEGDRGFPVATIAFYGPNRDRASKVAVGIITHSGGKADILERWFCEVKDIRLDESITDQILEFIKSHNVRSVAAVDSVIGCPHEEEVDYPAGEACPKCPYWAHRNRFTGEIEN